MDLGWQFDNSYARLSQKLFAPQLPEKIATPSLMIFNSDLALTLGLSPLTSENSPEFVQNLSGNVTPPGAEPISQAYAGHQFGHFTNLGDGRAVLLGEHVTPNNRRFDIQLKGSGQTPFSRRGDGKAAVGPMLREYVISEAMFSLGIPTTRSLAVVATGEEVFRETILPGAILTRVAASHVRVGTFEYALAIQDLEVLRQLADYTIARHYPDVAIIAGSERYLKFLQAVMSAQADLIAQWMGVGFIHGVMNTDNMAISGETIDYGPCAFMDVYNEATVFSSIDRRGRYAYGNQPKIAHWNLAQFAASLIPLVAANEATAVAKVEEVLAKFPALYEHAWLRRMGQKLGFAKVEASDKDLINGFLQVLQTCEADFTNGFRDLAFDPLPELTGSEDFKAWRTEWEARLAAENTPLLAARQRMKNVNPRVIPRNHLVEKALTAASAQNDLTLIHALLAVLRNPFGEGAPTPYCTPPLPGEVVQATFCGT